MTLLVDTVDTPLGPITLASDGRALVALAFGAEDGLAPGLRARYGPGAAVRRARDPLGLTSRVRAYFAGALDALATCPIDGGGTPLDRRVWAALRELRPGETVSYSGLAARLGMPRAARAIGGANARNPIAVAVPCHRVVGADGALTGYAFGLERKRWLLRHEGAPVAVGGARGEALARSAGEAREATGRGFAAARGGQ